MYLTSILWYLSWPLLIYVSYLAVWFMITQYEKRGMFKVKPVDDDIRE